LTSRQLQDQISDKDVNCLVFRMEANRVFPVRYEPISYMCVYVCVGVYIYIYIYKIYFYFSHKTVNSVSYPLQKALNLTYPL
jgi:hypothetical protein